MPYFCHQTLSNLTSLADYFTTLHWNGSSYRSRTSDATVSDEPGIHRLINAGSPTGIFGNPANYAWGPQFDQLLAALFQANGSNGTPPAAESEIENLPTIRIDQSRVGQDCTICQDTFELEDEATELPCSHVFHPTCVVPWLKMHNQCPLCRYELRTDDTAYEARRQTHPQPFQ
ncbi:hypothetical protein PROFUN_00407 [Planoprotostelium fungivorum]|uniref:RING-type domain-containing protein n=1 Tax=Planoprotostelium fungivorum TaxID=1890364 RepID=A0A2P6NYC0_9EUKA|nr:hypothetical protein PROFUN_00407 [Planoprotostelium fungivorum]